MKIRKRVVAATMVAAAMLGSLQAPAHAVLTLYMDTNFRIGFRTASAPESIPAMGLGFDNVLSSYNNDTQWDGAWWHDTYYTGRCIQMPRRSNSASFALWDNDKMSSWTLGNGC
ncbi:hypothetical protein CGZ91_00880 [Parenemella sanctibonifatiensis]|uniref:Uncharacterized protein n=1 Tax=Parenemella sanctibonifatiensis TaxID=2016505 RepID=A0A255E8A1_9ACTN|nr:hypothetical protein CGZ92_05895 [Parenemella sanctibonifatiensis]OYN92104.1 hypothetical protein CGZ91_00880 [Parenemella sanctibonifatiensis]